MTADRIGADDQFAGIEGAGERRIECGRYGAGRAAAHHQAEIVAAEIEDAAHERCGARTDLRVSGLKPDRRAATVGNQCLTADDKAVAQRQSSAAKRVGFDRVRRLRYAPPPTPPLHPAQQEASGGRRCQRRGRAEERVRAQPDIDGNPVDDDVRELRRQAHQSDRKPRKAPGHERQRNQHELIGADEGAKPCCCLADVGVGFEPAGDSGHALMQRRRYAAGYAAKRVAKPAPGPGGVIQVAVRCLPDEGHPRLRATPSLG
jgi:hypothetical protein